MPIDKIKLQNSLGHYFLAVNPSYRYVEFQQKKIFPALEQIEAGKIKRLAIFLPPGFSKSDSATRTFIPWYMGRHPDHNAMVCSYSADLASDDFGARIKERMKSDTHLAVFPDSKLTQDSRSKTHFRTVKGGTFYSVGFTGSATGKRLNLLLFDDLIKNFEDAESPGTQDKLFEDYKGTYKDRLRPDGCIVMCMHRWAIRDIAARILELDGTVENGGEWTVLKLKAEDPPDSGNYLWLRKKPGDPGYPLSYYESFKADDKVWAAKFQQDPGSAQNFWFRQNWLNFYEHTIPAARYNNYLIIDPAGGKGKPTDWTSMHVWAAGQDEKVFLADWVHDKLDPGERMSVILGLVRRWRPQRVLYEEYGLVQDTFYITRAMRDANLDERFYPISVGGRGPRHNMSKNARIEAIKPWFREGKIWLPKVFPYKQFDGKVVDLTKRFLEEEYNLFKGEGSIAHEDDLDNMSRLLEPELNLNFFVPPNDDDDDRDHAPATSWEARY